MSVLERVLACDDREVTCEAHVADDCPFVRAGELPGVALVEYMAQAVAAYVSLGRRRTHGSQAKPRPGYLIGARDVELRVGSVPVGERFEVNARLEWNDGQVARFSCRVVAGERCLAQGQLTVYERDEEAA
jgi:predicted hotdog family 3-hydroxylacyl-ACP dehydratase